jgi:hypothetical protein
VHHQSVHLVPSPFSVLTALFGFLHLLYPIFATLLEVLSFLLLLLLDLGHLLLSDATRRFLIDLFVAVEAFSLALVWVRD